MFLLQGLLDKHGRENSKTPKGWTADYKDLTPKATPAAEPEQANGAASAVASGAAEVETMPAEDGSDPGEKKKKKKDKKVIYDFDNDSHVKSSRAKSDLSPILAPFRH